MLDLLLTLTLAVSPLSGELPDAERKAAVAKMTRDELAQAMKETPVPQLLAMGEKAVHALGTYSFRMTKRERIKGELHEEQQIIATIREAPFAVRLEFIGGPGKGRRVLYNASIRKRDFRVREPGVLSILGGLWIDVDSALTKNDSRHSILESGLGNLLRRFKQHHDRAIASGGLGVTHEGWDAKGHFCSLWTTPNNGVGFDAARSRICTDLKSGLPSKVEAYDQAGQLLERYEFFDARSVTLSDAFLKPEGF